MLISAIKLATAAILTVILAVAVDRFAEKEKFSKISYAEKQILIGLLFGAMAVLGTEWGISMNGAQVNCRDAAPLIAGLFFGGPAGIIAGIIGGVERWFAVLWGVGSFTRVACSVSTILAGIVAAFLRKYLFDGKRPNPVMSLFAGISIEVFHLSMVFFTNVPNAEKAINVVRVCTAPVLIANGAAVMLVSLVLGLISGGKNKGNENESGKKVSPLFKSIQNWLLAIILVAFVMVSGFMIAFESSLAASQVNDRLTAAMREVKADLSGKYAGVAIEDGFFVILDENKNVASASDNFPGNAVFPIDSVNFSNLPKDTVGKLEVNGVQYYYIDSISEGYEIAGFCTVDEAMFTGITSIYISLFNMILVFAVLFVAVYLLIKKSVLNQIVSIAGSLKKISEGNLQETVDVRSNVEFASLSDDINTTVDTLKRYIAEAEGRIDAELEFARNIQLSSLPNNFPAFPNRREFDIYARMNTAKEVGGDFYDFYFTDANVLNFLIADVSGKGIPAAMFMMRAKTVLRSIAGQGCEINDVFTEGNNLLCQGNDANMFVTAWQAAIDLKTGVMSFVNAGHNPPLVRHADGRFEFLKVHANLVLATMEGIKYIKHETSLVPGDIVFLYTDGVTEATNADNELYGEARLEKILNSRDFKDMKEICDTVKADVDSFVGEAPQFDDITMVAFIYKGMETKHE